MRDDLQVDGAATNHDDANDLSSLRYNITAAATTNGITNVSCPPFDGSLIGGVNYFDNPKVSCPSLGYTYSETLSNHGNVISNTVSTTAPFTYSLSEGITFKDSNNDDVMDNPPTINNLARGLTAVWHLTAGDTAATLELIGQAQDHDIIDNVSLDIIFDNSSVTGGIVPELDCTSSIGTAFFPNPRMRHGKIFSKGGEQNMSFGKRN